MEVAALVESLIENDAFFRLINDPLAQLGPAEQPYLGASIMPEVLKEENEYTEEGVRYVSVMPNHGTRYSPVQIKEGMMVGSIRVSLGNSDIGSQMNGQQYDTLIKLMRRVYGRPGVLGGGVSVPSMDAMMHTLKWVDKTLVQPLHMRNELDRWNAIVYAQVDMYGDNGYHEVVQYPNPQGHRVNAGGTWSSNTYDLWMDIIAQAEFMRSKGLRIARIIIPSQVLTIMANNLLMRQRAGHIALVAGMVNGVPGRLSISRLNELASDDGLPPFELYDTQYQTQNGGQTTVTSLGYTLVGNWYLPRNVMVFIAATGRDEEIDRGDMEPIIYEDTLGYVGVGRPAGQTDPGMVVEVEAKTGKAPHINGQAWQTSLPIITEPEAVCVIGSIA